MQEKEIKILKGARKLYKQYGIRSVTMDDVANHLGISKKTLYQFVKDKNELVKKVIENDLAMKNEGFTAIFDKNLNAIDELLEVNKYINKLFKEYQPGMEFDLKKYYPEYFLEVKGRKRERMFKSISENLKRGISEGLYRKELDVDLLSKLHVFRCENLIEYDVFSRDELISDHFVNELFTYHMHGIASEKGLKYLKQINQSKN
ncbi:MAG: TetR/AcrR family transcriptional regulator [Bacteroidales bacterium]|nr:TetR/AcrR family transcriptional regulator [Bacteroidales bacterium]MCF8343151.1 TetR/AcrR family transcriptional regulator [Bacteroidales bacterium]MCF8350355.1 TetR/AcrR family transcriptional regulator [Bacteroidales bacterium]MCF8376487.1 TetR/AcrR family transcriptional regulator [Bacteroidales bacterium]MCF8401489.1 TetR/AcrR family transcriptional regulator [Bacteroidales bacterium]